MAPQLASLEEMESALRLVRPHIPETAVSVHPSLNAAVGCRVWLKHENATPAGAFKVRGGIVYLDELLKSEPGIKGVVAASTGNHGRSIAWSAQRLGLRCVIVVPLGNPTEKNTAIRALGAELVEHGHDFQSALEHSRLLAANEGLHAVPSFHPWLVRGVATYALEFLRAAPVLDVLFVPIGLGSGAVGMLSAIAALGLSTRVIGVVSSHAPAYALSFQQGRMVTHPSTTHIAEGVACSTPNSEALSLLSAYVHDIISVSDEEALDALRLLREHTGLLVEGSAALPLAALKKSGIRDGNVGLILTGGNISQEIRQSIPSLAHPASASGN